MYDITFNVDRIVHELRNGQSHDKSRLLQEAIYYLPSLRNEKNIPLLAVEILNSPLYLPDVKSGLLLVDAFQSACMRKFQISDPTIPFEEWLDHMFVGSYSLLAGSNANNGSGSLWRVLPLLTGLILAVKTIKDQHTRPMIMSRKRQLHRFDTQLQFLFSSVANPVIESLASGNEPGFYDPDNALTQLTALCIAKAGATALDPESFGQLSTAALPLVLVVVYQSTITPRREKEPDCNAIAGLQGLPATDSIMMSHLSSVSLFVQRFLENRHPPLSDVDELLNRLLSLSVNTHVQTQSEQINKSGNGIAMRGLVVNPNLWNTLKPLYFGVLIQLRAVASTILHRRGFPVIYLAEKALKVLQPLHFIIEELGVFETYNYVFHVCVDTILETQFAPNSVQFQDFVLTLVGSCNPGAIDNQVGRGNIVFALDLVEMLVPKLPSRLWDQTVYPFINEFLQPVPGVDISTTKRALESAHSVMLSHLSNAVNIDRPETFTKEQHNSLGDQLRHYFSIVTNLFPTVLSHQQYTLTVRTIAKAVTNPVTFDEARVDLLLMALFEKAKTTIPGIRLPEQAKWGEALELDKYEEDGKSSPLEDNIEPPTIRAVVVSNLVHVLPLLDRAKFQFWLNRCAELAPKLTFSPMAAAESEYIHKQLQYMISNELDLSLADQGIQWLFSRGGKI